MTRVRSQESEVRGQSLPCANPQADGKSASQASAAKKFCRGFTLLEVVLALGLTAVVLALVGTSVNTTLKTIESGRRRTEREQLARAIMHRIADDLRAVVRCEPLDDSGLNSDIGGLGGLTGGSATAGGSSQTGGNSSTGGNNTATGQNSTSSTSGQTESGETTDETVPVQIAGIYGYQDSVQMDITRIPRLDESLYADGVNAPLYRGDVRTVTYYLGSPQNVGLPGALMATPDPATVGATQGLMRTEADRAMYLWQTQTGSAPPDQSAVVVAPEVALLEFRYFDGTQWLTQWDSTAMGGVPRAVEIAMYLYDEVADPTSPDAADLAATGVGSMMNNPDNYYRMVVHLPSGIPLSAVPPITTDDGTQQDTGTSTGASSQSGTPQTGGPQ